MQWLKNDGLTGIAIKLLIVLMGIIAVAVIVEMASEF